MPSFVADGSLFSLAPCPGLSLMWIEILLFTAGLVLLYFGAEALVGGASAIALEMGITPLVVGLTVVAFGTSSPELLVCLTAALEGVTGTAQAGTEAISIGNIIGSNIANIALILGCASLIRPIRVTAQAVRREYPLMMIASLLLTALIIFDPFPRYLSPDDGDLMLTRIDGIILFTGMIAYLVYSYVTAMFGDPEDTDDEALLEELEEVENTDGSTLTHVLKIAGGMLGLAAGAYLMVESAVAIANFFEIPQLIIGISIVALGTSLPELATSVVAALNEESDISVGNVIGSNLFNILLVLGLVSIIAPIHVEAHVLDFDIWMMLGVAVFLFPILWTGDRISRWEGIVMLVVYFGYITLLFLRPGPTPDEMATGTRDAPADRPTVSASRQP